MKRGSKETGEIYVTLHQKTTMSSFGTMIFNLGCKKYNKKNPQKRSSILMTSVQHSTFKWFRFNNASMHTDISQALPFILANRSTRGKKKKKLKVKNKTDVSLRVSDIFVYVHDILYMHVFFS